MGRVKARQLNLKIKLRAKPTVGWGGARKGAGRPRRDGMKGPGVKHRVRPLLAKRFPVHVTWRINREVWSLRTNRFFRVLERVMYAGEKEDFRVVHYAFLKDHIHLI